MKKVVIITRSKSGDTEHYPLLGNISYEALPQPILEFCKNLFLRPLTEGIGLNDDQIDRYADLYSEAVDLHEKNEYYRVRLQDNEPEKIDCSGLEEGIETICSCFEPANCKSWVSEVRVKGDPPQLTDTECDYSVSILMWNFPPFDKIGFIYNRNFWTKADIVVNRMALILSICKTLYQNAELPLTEEEKVLLIIHDEEWGGMPSKTFYVLSEFTDYLSLESDKLSGAKDPNDDYIEGFAKLTDTEIVEYSKYISRLEIFKHTGAFWNNINHFNFKEIDRCREKAQVGQLAASLRDIFGKRNYDSVIYKAEYTNGKFVIPEYYLGLDESILKLIITELDIFNESDENTVIPDFSCYIVYHSHEVIENPPKQYLFAQEIMEYSSMGFTNSLMRKDEEKELNLVKEYYYEDGNVRKYGVFKTIATNRNKNEQWTVPMVMLPMIHLCSDDIRKSLWPRYKHIIDSSIWNYYIPFVDSDKGYTLDIGHLYCILKKIARNTVNNLYKFSVAREYANLEARLVRMAYMQRMDSGHEKFVSPFVFHSEYEIEKVLTKNLLGKDEKPFCSGAKWRFLLLDDYANKPLKELYIKDRDEGKPLDDMVEEDNWANGKDSGKITGKLKIIIDDLKTRKCTNIAWCCPTEDDIEERCQNGINKCTWNWFDANGSGMEKFTDPDITIVCAKNIKDALNLMTIQRYDIILLDYLLDNEKEQAGREYSYYLLKIIDGIYRGNIDKSLWENLGIMIENDGLGFKITDKNNKCRIIDKKELFGPDGRLYFMYISAFVFAIQERLQEQHLLRSEPFWHIARGACPTNTPELFLYYLYRTMEKRYGLIMKQGDESVGLLIDFLYEIFRTNPRMESVKKFNTLLNLRAQYDRIKNDVYKDESEMLKMQVGDKLENGSPLDCRSSRLISSTFKDILYYGNSFWEHLQHLIYLTAYGTIRQWTEMWEEYTFIKPKLELNGDKGRKVCKAIENYIIDLKSNT